MLRRMKILNAYAGIGGNRQLWNGHEVTAVEKDPEIARIYKSLFPEDKVIVADAHEYIRRHYAEFDFIWSSPPCPTHSRMRQFSQVRSGRSEPMYPDFKLYEEVVFIGEMTDIPWVVENVRPWYEPLIEPQWLHRHAYWAPFIIPKVPPINDKLRTAQIPELQKHFNVDLSSYAIKGKRKILRNMVHPTTGLALLNAAIAWQESR